MDLLDRDKVLDLLNERREFLAKECEQNKDSEVFDSTEEIYETISHMPYHNGEFKVRENGRWKIHKNDEGEMDGWVCDRCKNFHVGLNPFMWMLPPPEFRFCPWCGSKMKVGPVSIKY